MINLTAASYAMAGIVVYYVLLFCLSFNRRGADGGVDFELPVVFVIPARNEAAVLEATVRTALAQDYSGAVRVLVVDDASTDGTGALADELATGDPRVRALHRDASVGGKGKSDVLNHAYRYIRAAAQAGDDWLGHLDSAEDACLCVLDADGHLSASATADAVALLSDERVGAVQIGVHIRNARDNLLARLQDLEFVGFSYMVQAARDRFGSVGLGGNGQYTRLAALEALGDSPWRATALTEDLDLGLRLQLTGWRLRFCASAYVAQEGLTSLRPLLRQRTRWTQGHYQCWRYIPRIVAARRIPVVQRLDTVAYLAFILLVVLVTVTGVIDFLGMLHVVRPVDSFLSWVGDGIAFRVAQLVFSWFPVVLVIATYTRFSGSPIATWEKPAYILYFAVYVYLWAVATARAWVRLATRRGGWNKTPRMPARARLAGGSMTACLAPLALLLILGTALSGCGGTTEQNHGPISPAAAQAARIKTPPLRRVRPQNRFAHGLPSGPSSPDGMPAAPGTLAGIASASVPAVVDLHNLAATIANGIRLPAGAIQGEASDESARLARLSHQAAINRDPAAPVLAGALQSYSELAASLGTSNHTPIAHAAGRLAAIDRQWRGIVQRLTRSRTTASNSIPPLLVPHASPSPAPTGKGR
jgi:1,2-diacylglycerol 3-beta-glucosyltransferase